MTHPREDPEVQALMAVLYERIERAGLRVSPRPWTCSRDTYRPREEVFARPSWWDGYWPGEPLPPAR